MQNDVWAIKKLNHIIKKYKKIQKMLKIELKTTYRDFSKIFLDDSTMEKSILKVPGSIYIEKHGFQGFYRFLQGFTRFYRVLIGSYWFLWVFTWFL